jgi:hypothetical protein
MRCACLRLEQAFATCRKVIGIEGSDPVAFKADDNAVQPFFFSLNCSVQCWRIVRFRLGVT